jgi:TPR repeat protein
MRNVRRRTAPRWFALPLAAGLSLLDALAPLSPRAVVSVFPSALVSVLPSSEARASSGTESTTRAALEALRGNPPPEDSLFLRHCRSGDALACVAASLAAPRQSIVTAEHVATLEKSCRAPERWACWAVGLAHREGLGTPKDATKADERWKRGCALDHPPSCAALGDDVAALERHCQAGWHSSCAVLALRKADFSVPEARDVARGDCDRGGAESCAWLAGDHDRRRVESEPLWRRSCDGNVARACAALGVRLYYRSRDPRVVEDARRAFERGCRLGSLPACADLAEMLRRGEGGPTDEPRGVALHREGCQGGYAPSCRALADLSYGSNRKEAVDAMERACALRDGEACCRLAWLFGLGAGTKWQPLRAAGFLVRARRFGATLLCGLGD